MKYTPEQIEDINERASGCQCGICEACKASAEIEFQQHGPAIHQAFDEWWQTNWRDLDAKCSSVRAAFEAGYKAALTRS
jgi:metal-dependent amidase/aminoacylase/carboxypeptidase family protein